MRILVTVGQPWDVPADVLAVPVTAGGAAASSRDAESEAELDRRLGGFVLAQRSIGEFGGGLHDAMLVPAVAGAGPGATRIAAPYALVVGLGDEAVTSRTDAVRLGGTIARRLAGRRVGRLAVWLPGVLASGDLPRADLVELVARGIAEGADDPATLYRDDVPQRPIDLEELRLVVPDGDAAALTARAERGVVIGEGTRYARALTNRAPNDLTPVAFADEAATVAARHGLSLDVIGPERARELGMGLFLAVGTGSDNPPRMIVLRSGPEGSADAAGRLLALVGKGVTFDSGGINLKDMPNLWEEKCDKAGGAAVLAAVDTIARLAPGQPLLAVIPAVENMPGSHSARPGDVLRALNGRTVEIRSTDAEGRLILGDAFTYAERLGATHLLGAATLTGITDVLGRELMTGHGEPAAWWDEVAAAGALGAEPALGLPLDERYRPSMDSWFAELTNTPGGGEAAYTQTGLFLREFRTIPWAWLDLSWRCWRRSPAPWAPVGGTGDGHATMVELALRGAETRAEG